MRILAINDLSCVGKCSLTVSHPIISACGIECNVLPTAILSTHTGGFTGYTFHDFTEEIPAILAHWKTLGLQFDCIYSGYLGSISQIQMVLDIKRDFLTENGLFIVDPVMGDNGKLYQGFTAPFVEKMRALCQEADYILPNMTEACYLADLPYPLTNTNAETAVARLKELCPRAIVTGIPTQTGISLWYANKQGEICTYEHENVEGFFHGAGDVFASAFVGCLMCGKSQEEALVLASEFTAASIRRSATEVEDKRYGLNFEAEIFPFLQKLGKA